MRYIISLFFMGLLCMATTAQAKSPYQRTAPTLDFTLHKLGPDSPNAAEAGPTLLIVGGIQGDEPGGFNAAALVASHYTVTKGSVWVVPDLNLPSIIRRSRGIHGDMNRKFAALSNQDPEFHTIRRIKSIIIDPRVDVVLNLHDGSGFYRPTWEDRERNPNRWGQSVIIDQAAMDADRFGTLEDLGTTAVVDTNGKLLAESHKYYLKNTHTHLCDKEMEKTLTYFAIRHGKPAFGIEASKQFSTPLRAYYHLQVLESFMHQMGISFTRHFPLTREGVEGAIDQEVAICLHDGRITLPLDNVRRNLKYVPMPKGVPVVYSPLRPLVTLTPDKGRYIVHYGNRRMTTIHPQYFDFDDTLRSIRLDVDGMPRTVRPGDVVAVKDSFRVLPIAGYRVNVIGVTRPGMHSEAGLTIYQQEFRPGFSLDTNNTLYRVEIYRQRPSTSDAFAGMLVIDFNEKGARRQIPPSNLVREEPQQRGSMTGVGR